MNGGKGLYSWEKAIPRSAVISKYTSRKRTKQQIDKKYGEAVAKYALCNARGRCVDANHATDAAARFANDARNTPFKNNSIIQGNTRFRLKASKRITPHQEIFTSYGADYWI
ncbi:SET domain-containing [Paramuricea clavata]|uniref:SET domain-containing n=1 Tax=Paramuricea clavata TaxID=317549 RepID=A0A7D9I0F8_PARCT|nr:SET domain-containing [Paramuricea clavata]